MTAPFGDRQRRRNREPALSEFPAWGLEIMMGLYGPDTVKRACGAERATGGSPEAIRDSSVHEVPRGSWARRLDDYDFHTDAPSVGDSTSTRPEAASARHVEPMTPVTMQLEAVNQLVHYLERKLKRH